MPKTLSDGFLKTCDGLVYVRFCNIGGFCIATPTEKVWRVDILDHAGNELEEYGEFASLEEAQFAADEAANTVSNNNGTLNE